MTLFIYHEGQMYVDDRKIIVDQETFEPLAPCIESKVLKTDRHAIAISGIRGNSKVYEECIIGCECLLALLHFYDSINDRLMEKLPAKTVKRYANLLTECFDLIKTSGEPKGMTFMAITNAAVWVKTDTALFQQETNSFAHGAGEKTASILMANKIHPREAYAQCRRAGIPVGDVIHTYKHSDFKSNGDYFKDKEKIFSLTSFMFLALQGDVGSAAVHLYFISKLFSIACSNRTKKITNTTVNAVVGLISDITDREPEVIDKVEQWGKMGCE